MSLKETTKSSTRPDLTSLLGKPNKLYKLLKGGEITEEELDGLHDLGFPGEVFDPENDLHVQMHFGVETARKDFETARQTQAEELRKHRLSLAKLYLTKHHPEIDPELVDDRSLEEIAAAVDASSTWQVGDEPVTIIGYDEEELALVTASGEILGFANAPRSDLERRNILEWVGERLTSAQARQAGIEAERNFWLAKISKQYDPQINKQSRIQTRLRALYEPVGKAYLDELISGHKGKAPLRSVKVGMLVMAYGKTAARVDIEDETKALAWAKKHCPDAVKVTETILKGQIPAPVKLTLTKGKKEKTGIFWYPGGEDTFSLK